METNDFALAQTLADGSGQETLIPETASITLQNSVLPHVKIIDGAPRFVSSDRPRFVLEEQLGAGGAGEVMRARDEDIGRSVAIKRLRGNGGASQTNVARFVEEMRVTGTLDHPNVVPVHDVGVDPAGNYFFVMRHVRGETLEAILQRLAADDPETHRRFGIERRVDIFKSILEAIRYAHSRGIVHRDLKPANIMVGPFGEVVVMDWGVAKPMNRDEDFARLGDAAPAAESELLERAFETQAGALVGTPAYMAPEQVRGAAVDERTDIYALSVVFHEMLYLEHYLAAKRKLLELFNGVVNESPPFKLSTSSRLQPMVPAELYWFVEQGLRKEPERRFQSVSEMIERLERRAAGEIVVQCHVTATRRMLHEILHAVDRHPNAFVIAAVVATLGLLAVIIYTLAA